MNALTWTYLVYLVVSVTLTVWVARTLHKNGRVFLVDAFHGNETLADSVNHLLVVGFYLINVGFVVRTVKTQEVVDGPQTAIEMLGGKIGFILLALGVMHFFNLYLFHNLRKRAITKPVTPPVPPVLPGTYPKSL
jgi:hypothetical protein